MKSLRESVLQAAAGLAAIGSCLFAIFSFFGVERAQDLLSFGAASAVGAGNETLQSRTTETPGALEVKAPIAIVIDEPTNLRAGPGMQYDILAQLEEGAQFHIVAQAHDEEGAAWYRVEHPEYDRDGETWIASWVVEVKPDDARIAFADETPVPPPTTEATATAAVAGPESPPGAGRTATPEPPAADTPASTETPAPVCNPGQWGEGCGAESCPADHLAVCDEAGSGWDCVFAPEQCAPAPPEDITPTAVGD